MATLTKEQATAHGLIKQVNAHYKAFTEAQDEAIENAFAIGDLLISIKESLPHGEFTPFVEQYFEFGIKWGQICMKAAGGRDIIENLEEKPKTVEACVKAITDATPQKKQKTKSTSFLEKPRTQSDAPPADADDDAEFNDHVAPARPVISGGDTFEPAEFAAVEANFAERVRLHNLEIGRYAARIKDSYEPYPASNQLESKLTVIKQQIQSVVGTILTCKVHDKPCPKCEDNGKPCKVCGGCGMVTKMTYDGMGGK